MPQGNEIMAQDKSERDARLRAALRENLRKRKMQEREARDDAQPEVAPPENAPPRED